MKIKFLLLACAALGCKSARSGASAVKDAEFFDSTANKHYVMWTTKGDHLTHLGTCPSDIITKVLTKAKQTGQNVPEVLSHDECPQEDQGTPGIPFDRYVSYLGSAQGLIDYAAQEIEKQTLDFEVTRLLKRKAELNEQLTNVDRKDPRDIQAAEAAATDLVDVLATKQRRVAELDKIIADNKRIETYIGTITNFLKPIEEGGSTPENNKVFFSSDQQYKDAMAPFLAEQRIYGLRPLFAGATWRTLKPGAWASAMRGCAALGAHYRMADVDELRFYSSLVATDAERAALPKVLWLPRTQLSIGNDWQTSFRASEDDRNAGTDLNNFLANWGMEDMGTVSYVGLNSGAVGTIPNDIEGVKNTVKSFDRYVLPALCVTAPAGPMPSGYPDLTLLDAAVCRSCSVSQIFTTVARTCYFSAGRDTQTTCAATNGKCAEARDRLSHESYQIESNFQCQAPQYMPLYFK